MNYNKKPKDRILFSSGPRDLQQKQLQKSTTNDVSAELLESLQSQIKLLKEQLEQTTISDSKLNDEIADTIKNETRKYKEQLVELESENIRLKDSIQNKDILIEQLRNLKSLENVKTTTEDKDPDRPEIETKLIDPVEKDLGGAESHIKIEQLTLKEKDNMSDKVGKLKKLLGKMS